MTINEIIERADAREPNNIPQEDKIGWIEALDQELYATVILRHEGFEDIPAPEGVRVEPLVKAPWDEMYIHYIQAQIDYALGDIQRYNNANGMYERVRTQWANYWNRTHLAIQPKVVYL